jgi:demethylmenaquinone methyltransferase/2-methoxy-6-polyprenyl-1,4-benzoquinol methylase
MAASKKLNLIEHISSKEKKQGYVNQMFEIIAPKYDFITVFLSYGMDHSWKRKLVSMAELTGTERVLDLACGTGDITFMMAKELSRGEAVGLDITQGMLVIAEQKRREMNASNVVFNRADIMQLPYPDQAFDRVTGGYALRNVPDVAGALAEIHRVLKPGGRFFSLDFGHPPNGLYRWAYLNYLIAVGSITGILLHGDADTYRYIPESLKRYPGQRGITEMMTKAGFVDCGFIDFMGGIMAINYGTKPR